MEFGLKVMAGKCKRKCIIIGIGIVLNQHTLTMIDALIWRRFCFMEIDLAHCFVMGYRMVFCKIISKADGTWFPVYLELALFDSVSYPIKSHIHCFGALSFNSIIYNALCTGVVSLDGCWWLWMTKKFKSRS